MKVPVHKAHRGHLRRDLFAQLWTEWDNMLYFSADMEHAHPLVPSIGRARRGTEAQTVGRNIKLSGWPSSL